MVSHHSGSPHPLLFGNERTTTIRWLLLATGLAVGTAIAAGLIYPVIPTVAPTPEVGAGAQTLFRVVLLLFGLIALGGALLQAYQNGSLIATVLLAVAPLIGLVIHTSLAILFRIELQADAPPEAIFGSAILVSLGIGLVAYVLGVGGRWAIHRGRTQ